MFLILLFYYKKDQKSITNYLVWQQFIKYVNNALKSRDTQSYKFLCVP